MAAECVVDFYDIEKTIAQLEVRVSTHKILLTCLDDKPSERHETTQRLQLMSQILYKMRAIRDAILVEQPSGYLH